MPDPDKEQQQALAQLESRVNACTANLEKRHAEHWKEVELLVSELEKQAAEMTKVGENVKKLIRANDLIMKKHEKDLAALRKKV